jgi:hypothetical protein
LASIAKYDTMFEFLKYKDLNKFTVVVMPDFFIDRIVKLPVLDQFYDIVKQKEKLG